MADSSGQALIRGINIDTISKDMLEEALIFKKEVKVEKTPSREIRWYQKTSGYLTTTGATKIGGIAYGAHPFCLEQSWTRNTSHVKKYFLESPTIDMEDETDSDVQIVLGNTEDLTLAVANDLDGDIWDVVSEAQSPTNINDVTSTAAWDAASGQDPYEDVAEAEQLIREQTKRNPKNLALYVSAKGYKDLKVWLVSTKGASIPGFSSQLVEGGVLLMFDAKRVVISENVTADYAMVADLKMAAVYKEFMPLTTRLIREGDLTGIGVKIRCWAHGITLLVRPKYVALISNTET
jgi:hypothetical protein